MLDSRAELAAVLRETFAYDVDPTSSADDIVSKLREDDWRLVEVKSLAKALKLLAIEEFDSLRAARQLLAVVDDIQGELDAADAEVVIEAIGKNE